MHNISDLQAGLEIALGKGLWHPSQNSSILKLSKNLNGAKNALFYFGLIVGLIGFNGRSAFSADFSGNKTIGKISIHSVDVFDTEVPSESSWPYRTVNSLHMQTIEKVIRRELLFKEGDVYRKDFIDETERNIRRFNFLRRVTINETFGQNNTVDIEIITQDTWTLEPQANFSRVGEQNNTKVGIVERNLLGRGKRAGLFFENDENGSHRSITYKDPQFLSRALTLEVRDVDGTELREYGGSISKPFRSTKTKNSFSMSSFYLQENVLVYSDGIEVGKFERTNRESAFDIGHAFKRSTSSTRRGTLGISHQRKSYAPIEGDTQDLLKPDLDLSIIEGGYQWEKLDFIKERHINKFDRDEDFNLAPTVAFALGVGQNWDAGKRIEVLPQLQAQSGIGWSQGNFTLFKTSYESRISHDTTDNLLWSTTIETYHRLLPNNTLAMNAEFDYGYRLDPEEELLLGEDNGLRGYPIGKFSGDKRILINLEDRVFLIEDYLHLVSLGGTAFFDSGYVWEAAETVALSDLHSSVGIGLRIAFSRSSRNEPIRIDLAYALNNNDKSSEEKNSRWVLSIQSGVKFGGNTKSVSKSAQNN